MLYYYCLNSLGLLQFHVFRSQTTLRFQLVQNSAARLHTNSKKRDHITPILASLHWLPVNFRIDFKIFTFTAINGQAPSYIADMLEPYKLTHSFRWSDKGLLVVLTPNLVRKVGRAFAVRSSNFWNALPADLRNAKSVSSFKSLLKTHLYRKCFLDPSFNF